MTILSSGHPNPSLSLPVQTSQNSTFPEFTPQPTPSTNFINHPISNKSQKFNQTHHQLPPTTQFKNPPNPPKAHFSPTHLVHPPISLTHLSHSPTHPPTHHHPPSTTQYSPTTPSPPHPLLLRPRRHESSRPSVGGQGGVRDV